MAEEPLRFDIFETELGWVAAVASEIGVVRMSLPESTLERARDHVMPEIGQAELSPETMDDLRAAVPAYCAGAEVDLSEFPIDTSDASPFFAKAWDSCRSIPPGETRSYAWLADAAGSPRGARVAGQAMARNRVALLVPCHRVIAADGGLGGFGGGQGLSMKTRLLRLEEGRAG